MFSILLLSSFAEETKWFQAISIWSWDDFPCSCTAGTRFRCTIFYSLWFNLHINYDHYYYSFNAISYIVCTARCCTIRRKNEQLFESLLSLNAHTTHLHCAGDMIETATKIMIMMIIMIATYGFICTAATMPCQCYIGPLECGSSMRITWSMFSILSLCFACTEYTSIFG